MTNEDHAMTHCGFADEPDYVKEGVAVIRVNYVPELAALLSDLRLADLWRNFSNDEHCAGWLNVDGDDIQKRAFRIWLMINDIGRGY